MKKTNKILALLLALMLALSVLPMTAMATEEATATKPENAVVNGGNAIYDAEDFMAMEVDGSYYLANDIDLSGVTKKSNKGYYYIQKFSGVLDGCGHTIYGVDLSNDLNATDDTNDVFSGIFEQLSSNNSATVIKNLNIGKVGEDGKSDLQITIKDEANKSAFTQKYYFGVLAGKTNGYCGVTIDNVNIYADINVTFSGSLDVTVAGFVGQVYTVNITNSSFNGSVKVERLADRSKYVGGFVGVAEGSADHSSTFKNCINNADITVKASVERFYNGVGGIVGVSKRTSYFVDCENNGTIDSNEKYVAGIVGSFWYNNNSVLAVIADCKTNGNVYNRPVDSKLISSTNKLRVFVYGCVDKDGNGSSQNLPVYDATKTYTDTYSYVVPISTKEEFQTIIGKADAYPEDGFYILSGEENKIDFTGKTYGNYVVEKFSGVLYGNGNSLENLSFNATSHAGFFRFLSYSNDSAILDLDFGSVTIVQTNEGKRHTGVLSAELGCDENGVTGYDAFVSDVDFYVDCELPTAYQFFGAVSGKAQGRFGIYDCNVYGNVTVADDTINTIDGNIGMFVGVAEKSKCNNAKSTITFVGSNNYANAIVGSSNNKVRVSGFIGYSAAHAMSVVDCANYGSFNSKAGTSVTSAFIAGYNQSGGFVAIADSVNFGSLGSNGTIGTAAAEISAGKSFLVCSVVEWGGKDIAMVGQDPNATSSKVNCSTNAAISMGKGGASVRIDPDAEDAGLRFKGYVSEEAIATLQKAFGSNAVVSYGMIITPTAFKNSAGDFTTDALNNWEKNYDFGGDKSYVNIVATPDQWYKGETGVFAASLNGLHGDEATDTPDMFDTAFSGRAYIKVTVDGKEVYALYADYTDANNSRVFSEIVDKALGDLLYTNDNGVSWFTDEACTEAADPEIYDFDEYKDNKLVDTDSVDTHTCYTLEQYADLVTLKENISK